MTYERVCHNYRYLILKYLANVYNIHNNTLYNFIIIVKSELAQQEASDLF